jgi:hypothetical protein
MNNPNPVSAYVVVGSHRHTGKDVRQVFYGSSPADAEKRAADNDILVASVELEDAPEPTTQLDYLARIDLRIGSILFWVRLWCIVTLIVMLLMLVYRR